MVMTLAATEVDQEKKETGAVPPVRNVLVVWYHETDTDLAASLDQHLQILVLRLNNRFKLHFFCAPKAIPQLPTEQNRYMREYMEKDVKEYQGKYANTLRHFPRAALFLPCVSPAFMERMWKDCARDPQLQAHLTQPAFPILPISMRPMVGSSLEMPLAGYAEGYEREVACAAIATRIEALLRKDSPLAEMPMEAPFRMLELPPVAEVPVARKRMFFFF